MIQTLEEVLERCIVKLKIPSERSWGTGFFVASDLVLTCAHVVKEANSQPIEVYCKNQDKFQIAIIEEISEPCDIALLRLISASNNFPCVYLDSNVRSSDIFYTFGYPDDFQNGAPITFDCEGITGDDPPLIKFKHGQARPGLSGSPLLNKRTGKVCGIVKFTRDRATDLGGGGILTETVFAKFPSLKKQNQQFHEDNNTWRNILKVAFSAEVERRVINYIQRWANRAQIFAKEFSDSRFTIPASKSVKEVYLSLFGNNPKLMSRKTFDEINILLREFSSEIHPAVTYLEIDSLLNEISILLMESSFQELSESERSKLRKMLLSCTVIDFEFDSWEMFGGLTAGIAIGAAMGAPVFGIGAFAGAMGGAIVGGLSSETVYMHKMSKEARTKVIDYVDQSVKELRTKKNEAVEYVLSVSLNES